MPQAALEGQLNELRDLTRTAGGEVVGFDIQRRPEIDPALYVGRGKVDELRELRLGGEYDLLICNEDLSPRQQRNLERELKTRVVDRTELILDIFAQQARTREGRLQVETAQLHHLLPRLIGAWDYHRQGGGIGTRGGPGEQQIEVERRRIRRRLKDLEKEIGEVQRQREQQRAGRRRSELQTVAIVGYTNAGKSTLLNVLTGAGVRAENRLFATLDPTTRRLRLPSGREILLTDTISSHGVPLRARTAADVHALYWFSDRSFLGRCRPAQTLSWKCAPGDYELICLPLKIKDGDGGPARVVLREMRGEQ